MRAEVIPPRHWFSRDCKSPRKVEIKVVNNKDNADTARERKSFSVILVLLLIHAPGFAHIFINPRSCMVSSCKIYDRTAVTTKSIDS